MPTTSISQDEQLKPRAHAPAGGPNLIASFKNGIIGQATTSIGPFAKAMHGDELFAHAGVTTLYHGNQQYSVTALSDSSGNVSERYAYTAYGQPTFLNASGAVQTNSAASNRYNYTGREWDSTLGLYHFRARWMSGVSGRFLTRDPIGYKDGANTYACNFALIGVDPSGQAVEVPCDAGAIANGTSWCAEYGGIKSGPKCYKISPSYPLMQVIVTCNDHDCEYGLYETIRLRTKAYCDRERSCDDFSCPCLAAEKKATCDSIWTRLREGKGCKKARNDMKDKCFIGREDAGHKQAREDAENAVDICEEKVKECKCKYWYTP